jgi:hypothetical protein
MKWALIGTWQAVDLHGDGLFHGLFQIITSFFTTKCDFHFKHRSQLSIHIKTDTNNTKSEPNDNKWFHIPPRKMLVKKCQLSIHIKIDTNNTKSEPNNNKWLHIPPRKMLIKSA